MTPTEKKLLEAALKSKHKRSSGAQVAEMMARYCDPEINESYHDIGQIIGRHKSIVQRNVKRAAKIMQDCDVFPKGWRKP